MSKAFEGYFTLYENGAWGSTIGAYPQTIPVESESLSVQKDIRFRDNLVGAGRAHQKQSLVPLTMAPKGAISYAFRSDDCLKVLYSHFQNGSYQGSTGGTYHYTFYPSNGNPNYLSDVPQDAPWGGTQGVYSLAVLKRLTQAGTNTQVFSNGVCDTLAFSLAANDEAKLKADFMFRSVDTGTAVSAVPNSASVGSYSTEPPFSSITGTVKYNGAALDVEGVTLQFKNKLELSTRLGARDSQSFKFGRHETDGNLGFDFPPDGLKYVGSMLGTGTFSLILNLWANGTSRVDFTLPCCVLTSFEVNASSDNYQATLPFRAFQSGTLPSVIVDVYTAYAFNGLDLLYDAAYGARNLSDYELVDAESGARTLSNYELVDRDLY